MSSLAQSFALKLNWTRQDLFGDLRVRHGIKLGLAGLLALFCTQVLRLPSDNWAILTLLVLMNGQYVGAFALKAIMRFTGTITGAVVGVWLASDYTSTPTVFLPIFFLVMAFAGYKFGQVGARQGPYAHFFSRAHHAGDRYRRSYRSGTSVAYRSCPNRRDLCWNYLFTVCKYAGLAALCAWRVFRRGPCCTEDG